MNPVVIRPATRQDCPALGRLYGEFHAFHVHGLPDRLVSLDGPPDTRPGSELDRTLATILQDDDAIILVAQASDQLIGLAEVYLRQDEANPRMVPYRYGYLQSLMVQETYRRQGVGAQLVAAAQAWARAKGASEMRLETWEFAPGPFTFYRRLGYRTLRRTLMRTL